MQRFGKLLFIALFAVVGSIFAITTAPPTADAAPAPRPFTQSTGTVKLTPVADTYVDPGNLAGNYGSEKNLYTYAQGFSAAPIYSEALLRFDLSTIPAGSVIEQATLRLYQYDASGADQWTLPINRITEPWDVATVTYRTKPASGETGLRLISPLQRNVEVSADITALVRSWRYQPSAFPNYGIMLYGIPQGLTERQFYSAEGQTAPVLEIAYSAPTTAIVIPQTTDVGKVDGFCDTQNEYRNAISYQYIDHLDTISTLYLKQDDSFLYACIEGVQDTFPLRHFSLYLDRNNGKEKYASVDDLALQVQVEDGAMSALEGTGEPTNTWIPSNYTNWVGVAKSSATAAEPEAVEYQVPLADVATTCGQPFGIALYHQSVADSGIDYGWPTTASSFSPSTWVQASLADTTCPIRVCWESATNCQAANTAQVYQTAFPDVYAVNRAGYVIDRDLIDDGQQIWAMVPITPTDSYTIYYTSGAPQTVDPAAYTDDPAGVMTLVVSEQNPLMVRDIALSAQWNLEGDPAYKEKLASEIRKASDKLYDFTNGQMALGNVTVYQRYEAWDQAQIWLHADNNQRPLAVVGGIVSAETKDPQLGEDALYYPGHVYIGSEWNRFYEPPGDPDIDSSVVISDDWASALAHELSHYTLYLYDTYYGLDAEGNSLQIESCTGSAMGWVYDEENTEFIADQTHWDIDCKATHAYQMLGARTEWDTMKLWYPWLILPKTLDAGPTQVPTNLTSVTFVPPTDAPTLVNDPLYQLNYQDSEVASDRARSYVLRGDRLFEQGQPPEGSTQLTTIGLEEGDRLCVFDIKNIAPTPNATRHQFGCEQVELGDNELQLEKDVSWAPVIFLDPIAGNSYAISITQVAPGLDLRIRVYPEHKNGSIEVALAASGDAYTGTVTFTETTPSAYAQLWVANDTATELDPRREAIAGTGVGGGVVPGPAQLGFHAPIIGPNGDVIVVFHDAVYLNPGEFIAIQETYAVPPLPPAATVLDGVAGYRLVAWPSTLVTSGVISLRYLPPPSLGAASTTASSTVDGIATDLLIYFWNGTAWQSLTTSVSSEPDGYLLASAPLRGTGLYSLFRNTLVETHRMYLPTVFR